MAKPVSRKELIRRFHKLGFSGPMSGGKHQFIVKGSLKVRIPNPHRGSISGPLVAEILRQAGISVKEWENPLLSR
jgi:hypothetical protein